METPPVPAPRSSGCLKVLLILGVFFLLLMVGTWIYLRRTFSAGPFQAVRLTPAEQTAYDGKVEWAKSLSEGKTEPAPPAVEREDAAARRFVLTEKELNALISSHPEAAEFRDRLRVDFREGSVALSANLPVPPGVPVLGGRSLRASAGAKLSFADGRLTLLVDSAAVGGIELPSAWMRDLKGRDLGAELMKNPDPALKKFLDGIESVRVREDRLEIQLRP